MESGAADGRDARPLGKRCDRLCLACPVSWQVLAADAVAAFDGGGLRYIKTPGTRDVE